MLVLLSFLADKKLELLVPTGEDCKWGCISEAWGELAEDEGPCFGLQGGYAISHQGSGPRRNGSWGICLPWLSYPLNNRKHLWHQSPKCHHSCCHAELRKADFEVTTRCLDEVEAMKLYNTRILPIFLYGSDCWTISKRNARRIDALEQ